MFMRKFFLYRSVLKSSLYLRENFFYKSVLTSSLYPKAIQNTLLRIFTNQSETWIGDFQLSVELYVYGHLSFIISFVHDHSTKIKGYFYSLIYSFLYCVNILYAIFIAIWNTLEFRIDGTPRLLIIPFFATLPNLIQHSWFINFGEFFQPSLNSLA